ncbi:hypothetical protein HYV58_01765, partial [Candidatus Peregrinibacteria bacterium]|nr:hypothetical protein [Candidatus Peregrinibacteria bacterium]
MCVDVLKALNITRTPLLIDDFLHGIDELSLPMVASIVVMYILECDGVGVVSGRPEEEHQPREAKMLIKAIETAVGRDAVMYETAEGLDFSDEQISHDYAFYSFPEDFRQGKKLGLWHNILGQKAGSSPFAYDCFMNRILEDPANFFIKGDLIMVKQEILDEIGAIRTEDDFFLYQIEKIRHLPEDSKILLQALGLLGWRVSEHDIRHIAESVCGFSNEETLKAMEPLLKGGYLIEPEGKKKSVTEAGRFFEIQHDTMRDLIVKSMGDPAEQVDLSMRLWGAFKGRPDIPDRVKFGILGNIASTECAPKADEFWTDYIRYARACLSEGEQERNFQDVFHTADKVARIPAIKSILSEAVANGEKSQKSSPLLSLGVEAKMARVKSAMYVGKWTVADEGALELLDMAEKRPDMATRGDVQLLQFLKAYIVNDVPTLKKLRDSFEKERNIPPETLVLCNIRTALREWNIDEVKKIYQEGRAALLQANETHKGEPSPVFVEVMRVMDIYLPARALEASIKKVGKNKELDADVIQSGVLQPDQIVKLRELYELIEAFERDIRKKWPLILDPYAELSLVFEAATCQALFGNHKKAEETFGEAWRLSYNMGLHRVGAADAYK